MNLHLEIIINKELLKKQTENGNLDRKTNNCFVIAAMYIKNSKKKK